MKQTIARRALHLRQPWLLVLSAVLPLTARAAPSAGTPCVWQVRLVYHYHDAGPQGTHDTQVSLALATPLRCLGKGAETRLTLDGPTAAKGRAQLTGNIPHLGGPSGSRDTYDKHLVWPATDAAKGPAPSIDPPSASYVGTGFGTKVTIAGALAGEEHAAVVDPAAAAGDPPAARDSRAPYTVLDAVASTDQLNVDLYLDPEPGTPSDPAGVLAKVPERTRQALGAIGGEAALGIKGHLFGAQTVYTSDGSFSICYQKTLVLAPVSLDIDYCGWLTRGDQTWTPARLPPVESPLAP